MSALLAMPCYGSMLHVESAKSLIAAADLFDDFLVTTGESAITRGRSDILTTFLELGYDTLFMLDADCSIDTDGIERLLALDKPVRGAAVSLKTLDLTECLNVYRDGVRVTRDTMPSDPFECDFIGGACMVVTRQAILTMTAVVACEYLDSAGRLGNHLFHEQIRGDHLLTEDYSFCLRARECGLSVWCDPRVIVGHHEGRMTWRF